MQYAQGSTKITVEAVRGFFTAHADKLGAVPASGARQKIDEVATALDSLAREQEQTNLEAKLATQRRAALRQALIAEHMRPIANVAQAELQNFSELSALHMPRLNVSDGVLIEKARAMAAAGATYASAFSSGLMSADFVTSLEDATDALVAASAARAQSISNRQKATTGLKNETRVAGKRLRVIDSLVHSVIKHDPALVAAWKSVKRVAKKPGAPRTTITAGDIAPAPVSAPAPTPAVTPAPTAPLPPQGAA
jgi:hypothetical protein